MKDKSQYLVVKDHSVSGEQFRLVLDKYEDILKTHPQPKEEGLSKYYQSEDYISHTDTKRNLLERVYHFIRKRALKNKIRLIDSFNLKTKTLLDVGCGTGDFLKTAKDNGWKISGIEPHTDARKIANSKTKDVVFDIPQLSKFNANSFDVITLWHVLEHLPNLETHVEIFHKLLKENGRLVIAVPNYKSYDAAYYKSFWAAYDVPRHLWHFSQEGIKKLFSKFRFELEETHPMKFDSYYVSLLSEKYKRGFMNPLMAFYIGLRSNFKAKRSGEYSSLIYIFKKNQNLK